MYEIYPFKNMPLPLQNIALVHFNWTVNETMQTNVRSLFFAPVQLSSFSTTQIPHSEQMIRSTLVKKQ